MQALKQYLKSRPDIQEVYFNEKGEWLFSPNELHPICKKRDEVLDGDEPWPETADGVIEALKLDNASLTDKIVGLEIEKEALQKEVEALKATVEQLNAGTQPPPPAAEEPDSKKDKSKK